MSTDGERWDNRHAASAEAEPGPPLRWPVDLAVPSGRMLDVACGTGSVAVWAAQHDLEVVALDVSPVAVARTAALAISNDIGDSVDARVHDLSLGLPPDLGGFDLIVAQRYRNPELIPALIAHMRQGGVLVLTTLSEVGADRTGRHHAPAGELRSTIARTGLETMVDVEGDGLATVVCRRSGQARSAASRGART